MPPTTPALLTSAVTGPSSRSTAANSRSTSARFDTSAPTAIALPLPSRILAASASAGPAFRVIEAKSRTGGRAYTDYDCFGVPFDHGCHWLHSASINPFTALAERYGFTYRRGKGTRKLHDGADWLYGERLDQAGAFI